MSKAEKLFDEWRIRTPVEARARDVETFLKYYFDGMWSQGVSSHIVVRCDDLKTFADYQPYGEITVPVKSGKLVKGRYIKALVRAVALLKELGVLP